MTDSLFILAVLSFCAVFYTFARARFAGPPMLSRTWKPCVRERTSDAPDCRGAK